MPTKPTLTGVSALAAHSKQTGVRSDPIFAAIERHRGAEFAFSSASADTRADTEKRVAQLASKSDGSYADLLDTNPATIGGCAALLRYLEEHEIQHEGAALFANCTDRVKKSGRGILSRIANVLDRGATGQK